MPAARSSEIFSFRTGSSRWRPRVGIITKNARDRIYPLVSDVFSNAIGSPAIATLEVKHHLNDRVVVD
jgi:hypothetical protein